MHISTRIVIFLIVVNSAAGALDASGVAESWGVEPHPGLDQEIKELDEAMGNISPSSGIGSTLFALYTSVTSTFKIVFNFIFYGPTMFGNLGVPDWLTGLVFGPMYLIAGTGIGYALTGRRM